MKHLILILALLTQCNPSFANKIQQQGFKNASDCAAAGVPIATCLLLDSQVYISANGVDVSLHDALVAGTLIPNVGAPTGTVAMFAGSTAPSGWKMCDGSAISRTTFSALFAIVGTTYGTGDGTTTFNIPNTQGIFVRGAGSQTIAGLSYSGTLASTQLDQFQGHKHQDSEDLASAPYGNGGVISPTGIYSGSTASAAALTSSPFSDGGDGVPRFGPETRPANISLNYIIKN